MQYRKKDYLEAVSQSKRGYANASKSGIQATEAIAHGCTDCVSLMIEKRTRIDTDHQTALRAEAILHLIRLVFPFRAIQDFHQLSSL